jgi:hypothetical protein
MTNLPYLSVGVPTQLKINGVWNGGLRTFIETFANVHLSEVTTKGGIVGVGLIMDGPRS